MAATQAGIVTYTDGTIRAVVKPTNDAALDSYPLKTGESMTKMSLSTYGTYSTMKALASANGMKE